MPYAIPPIVQRIISNPVSSRNDLVGLLHDLISPLADAQSTGGARIKIGHSGTHFDTGAAEFEGYARALWGLTPLWAIEPDRPEFVQWRDKWIEGLKNGTDAGQEEYWGDIRERDQRMVESAAMGFSLCLAPKVFWDPLSDVQKENVAKWLLVANDHGFPDNNWRYFRVFLNLGLKNVGAPHSQSSIDAELDFMESFIGTHGFPADGVQPECRGYDYYATSFAIPFYGLIYSRLNGEVDPVRAKVYRQRAQENLPFIVHLFGTDGAAIPYGRSMTYRFACAAFFAALAFDTFDLPAPFTWGVIKGIVLRHIRWFTQKESVFNRDGTLTIGWGYPSLFMSEDYNSAQSPYWALKTFLILALPETHPFWTAKEEAYPAELLSKAAYPAPQWGQVMSHAAGHDFMLSSGPALQWPMRGAIAKYGKLAYSAQFGFSMPGGEHGLMGLAPDSTLALSDDPRAERWVARDRVESFEVREDGVIKSIWKPWADTSVTTYLIPPSTTSTPYHTRLHHIVTPRDLLAFDGGWAIHSHSGPTPMSERRLPVITSLGNSNGETVYGRWESTKPLSTLVSLPSPARPISNGAKAVAQPPTENRSHAALAHSSAGASGVVDLLQTGDVRVIDVDSSTNLISPRTVIPGVRSAVRGGGDEGVWLASRVWGVPYKAGEGKREWVGEWEKGVDERFDSLDQLVKRLGLEL